MTISETLSKLKTDGRKALAAFSTVGDPDMETSLEIFRSLGDSGADILELGIPYSDPLMDGPVLQRSYTRALRAGFKVAELPGFAEKLKKNPGAPMLVMTCCNPIFKYGDNRFFRDISSAGVDSVLVTDLPPEEWGETLDLAKSFNVGTIFLVTPTTPIKRMEMLDSISDPFVYCVSKAGVTGTSNDLPEELGAFAAFVRDIVTKPLLIGFGISTPEHARVASKLADGVIVGSAFASLIEMNAGNPEGAVEAVGRLAAGMRSAMDG